MATYKLQNITGVISAMTTTFDEHENLDLHAASEFTEYLIGKGINGLYLTGSTGEGFLMTGEERAAYVEAVVGTVNGRVPVIVHVGAIGTKLSIDLARQAEAAGADAVSSVPPFYWRFNADDIHTYYKDISSAVTIPMVVYNVPLAGLMNNSLIYRLAELPGVQGLKFTGREHDDMCEIKQRLGKDFMIYSGCDEMAAQGLLAEADGIIGSFYNLMPETFLKINGLAKAGKYQEAFAIQKRATELIHFMVQFDFYPLMKACLRQMGVNAGYGRRPFAEPDAETLKKVDAFCADMKRRHGATGIDFIDNR